MLLREALRSLAFPLAGSAVLTAFALAQVPFSKGLLRAPSTPFDRSASGWIAPAYRLLSAASSVIPTNSSVTVRTEPPSPVLETHLHRFAVALLPNRRLLPGAIWDVPTPELAQQAEFLIIRGPKPADPQGALILQTPDGTVWRR